MDGVENDLRKYVVNCKTMAKERDVWRRFSEQAKTNKGLKCQQQQQQQQ
jgi:hypothetical protein